MIIFNLKGKHHSCNYFTVLPVLVSGGVSTNFNKKGRRISWIQNNESLVHFHNKFHSVSVHLRLVVDGGILHKTTLALCLHAPSVYRANR